MYLEKKAKKQEAMEVQETPSMISLLTFGMAVPHSYLVYKLIWADPCSAAFFTSYEIAMSWIATTSAFEGSAAVGLGYIDYKLVTGNS